MAYFFERPRWPDRRGPFDLRRTQEYTRRPFVITVRVRGRSRELYEVSSQQPASGWSLNVVVPDRLDLWLSYLHDERSKTRLVKELFLGPACSLADRDRVFADFGLRSTLRVSNV